MTESESWRFFAGQRLTQCRADVQIERRPPFGFDGQAMIRHGSHSGTVTATSFGVHGATTGSCLIASPSFPLPIVAGLLRAGVDAIDLASIAPPADKNLRAAATHTGTSCKKRHQHMRQRRFDVPNSCALRWSTLATIQHSERCYVLVETVACPIISAVNSSTLDASLAGRAATVKAGPTATAFGGYRP